MKLPRSLRIVLISLATLVGLTLLAAVALLMLVDPNDYKSEIERVVKNSKQRTLNLQGDLKLTLYPRLGIDLGKATLSEHNSAMPFASVSSAHVSVALLPLLQKQLLIDRLRIDGLNATLTRDADGKTNIDDLLQGNEQNGAEAPSKPDNKKSGTVQFDVAGIELNNSTLALRDAMTQTVATLSQINFKTGRLAKDVPTTVDLNTDITAQQPSIKAHLATKTGLQFDLEKGQFKFSDVELKLDGNLPEASNLALTFNAVKLETSGKQLLAENIKLRAKGLHAADQFEAKLDVPQLSLTETVATGEGIKGSLNLEGTQTLDLKFDTSNLSGTASDFLIDKLTLVLDRKQGDQSVQMQLSTPLKGHWAERRFELSDLSSDLVLMGTADATLHLNGKLVGDLLKESLSADLNGRIDSTKWTAQLGLTNFSDPDMRIDIGIDQINLDRYLSDKSQRAVATSSAEAVSSKNSASASGESKPLDLGVLKKIKAQGSVRVGSLQAFNIRTQSVVVGLHADDGRLQLEPVTASLYQGSLSGSAMVTASNQFALRQTLSGVAINPLMKDALNRDVLEGRGDVVLDVNTSGTNVDALKRGLNGTARMALRDGAVKGFNLAKSLRDFKTRIGSLEGKVQGKAADQTQETNATEKTDFSELSASFNIRNGVASNNDLMMKSPFLRVGGAGEFDLINQRLDYVAKATVVNTSGGQDGKDLAQLTDLTIPVRLSGPFNQPSYSIEWSGVASKALENKLKSKLSEKLFGNGASSDSGSTAPANQSPQDQFKEKLKDKLKGLLSR